MLAGNGVLVAEFVASGFTDRAIPLMMWCEQAVTDYECKAAQLHAPVAFGREGREELELLIFLDLGSIWKSVFKVAPQARLLLPSNGKDLRYPWGRNLVGIPEPMKTQRLKENSSGPAGDWTPISQLIVRRCTDWATLVQLFIIIIIRIQKFFFHYIGLIAIISHTCCVIYYRHNICIFSVQKLSLHFWWLFVCTGSGCVSMMWSALSVGRTPWACCTEASHCTVYAPGRFHNLEVNVAQKHYTAMLGTETSC
jgi:hypothetical protein